MVAYKGSGWLAFSSANDGKGKQQSTRMILEIAYSKMVLVDDDDAFVLALDNVGMEGNVFNVSEQQSTACLFFFVCLNFFPLSIPLQLLLLLLLQLLSFIFFTSFIDFFSSTRSWLIDKIDVISFPISVQISLFDIQRQSIYPLLFSFPIKIKSNWMTLFVVVVVVNILQCVGLNYFSLSLSLCISFHEDII